MTDDPVGNQPHVPLKALDGGQHLTVHGAGRRDVVAKPEQRPPEGVDPGRNVA